MHAAVSGAEVGVLQGVVDGVFVVFGYMENEWAKTSVLVAVVLAPGDCSPYGDDDACGCFADFHG